MLRPIVEQVAPLAQRPQVAVPGPAARGVVVALGSIVDDAIIDVENIVRRLRQHRKEGGTKSTATVILEASLEIRSVILYATLIIVLAVAPVLFMGGLGAFFVPLALSYSLALLASMVVALTVTPALCLILLTEAAIERESRRSGGCSGSTRPWSDPPGAAPGVPRHRCPSRGRGRGLAVAREAAALVQGARLPDALAHPAGHVAPGDVRVMVLASKELRAIPGVRNFGAHIGRAPVADEVVGIDFTGESDSPASIPRSTTTKPWAACRRRSPATPASTATCRPTCGSG